MVQTPGGRFGYFFLFSAGGRGRGSPGRQGGGGWFLLKIQGEGGLPAEGLICKNFGVNGRSHMMEACFVPHFVAGPPPLSSVNLR